MTVIPYWVVRWNGLGVEWEIILDEPDDWHQDEGFPPEEWTW